MGNAYRVTIVRTVLIAVIIAVATGLVNMLMGVQYDVVGGVLEETRPSAWTVLGVASMLAPFLALCLVALAWWYNRPGSARVDNRMARTVGLGAVFIGAIIATVVIVANDPLSNPENSSIFWRGVLSGLIAGVALLICEWILLDLLRRSGDRLRRCEQLLDDWHTRPGWEPHLPA